MAAIVVVYTSVSQCRNDAFHIEISEFHFWYATCIAMRHDLGLNHSVELIVAIAFRADLFLIKLLSSSRENQTRRDE